MQLIFAMGGYQPCICQPAETARAIALCYFELVGALLTASRRASQSRVNWERDLQIWVLFISKVNNSLLQDLV